MRIQLVTFLILISCLNVFSRANAQKISLQVKQADLETVFRAIERQTDYHFTYAVSVLAKSKAVTVELKNVSLKEALDHIFMELPYMYEILGKTILIKAKPVVQSGPESNKAIIIKGKVTDKQNQPLEGVSIRIKGASTGTLTDKNGNYSIESDPNGVIVFSYVGYRTFEIKVNGQSEINMTLIENTSQLEETVVKGYYTTTKKLNTGSVSSVKAEDIERQPISDPILTLQGRVPGLLVQQLNGVPGRQNRIRLRGQNSIQNGNDPLFIVDGVQYGSTGLNERNSTYTVGGVASPFNYLNPSDIESIDVLKDADATAIYGSRGANGVILITTKKGKQGQTKFDVSVYTGFSQADKRVNFMKTKEYLEMRRQAFDNDNSTPGPADFDLNGTWDQNGYTDWQEVLIGGSAPVTESSASLSGGTRSTTFRIGSTFRKEGTIFPGDFSTIKASTHFNVNHRSENDKLFALLTGSYVVGKNNLPVGGLTLESDIGLPPNAPNPYNEDGSLNWENSTWINPYAIYERRATEKSNNLIGNLQVGYKVLKNLEIKSNFGYNTISFDQSNIQPITAIDPAEAQADPGSFRYHNIIKNKIANWIIEPQISHSSSFLKGKLDALIGATFQSAVGDYLNLTSSGYQSDVQLENIGLATNLRTIKSGSEYKYNAFYGRIGYNYHDRYLLNFTGRRDGSSRFGPGKRFGNFGSIAAAWIFSNEEFLKFQRKWLSTGKLRLSYGTTGNDQIGDYNYLDTYSSNIARYQNNQSLIPTKLTNPFYGWERVDKLEAGLELGFLNGSLNFNTNFYQNKTKNQLVQYGLPSVTGFPFVIANIPAVLQNSGFEFSLEALNIHNANFHWSTNVNLSIPRSKLIRYDNLEASSYARRFVVGLPTFLYFRYRYTGKDPNNNQYTFDDINQDGGITSLQDQLPNFIGPRYFGGIQNNLKYKGIELDLLFQFTKQNGDAFIINGLPRGFLINQPIYPGYENDNQNLSATDFSFFTGVSNFLESDGVIRDASFISLKNISLSYEIPISTRMSKTIKNAKLFFQGQNLLILSDYLGFNPEAPNSNITIPLLKTITFGLKAGF